MAMRGQSPPPTDLSPTSVDVRLEDAYRTSGTAVLGYALRRCDSREDALDVVAETFATAWRRRADMPADPAEARPWLFGLAGPRPAHLPRGPRRGRAVALRHRPPLPGQRRPQQRAGRAPRQAPGR